MDHLFVLTLNRVVCCLLAVTSWQLRNAQEELKRRRRQAGIDAPGAYSPSATNANWIAAFAPQGEPLKKEYPSTPAKTQPAAEDTVRADPTILTAFLKQNIEAVGRVYLLLRYLDPQGRGWLDVDVVRKKLTKKGSPLRICSWRRLRQILAQGDDVFWTRDHKGRLWIRGAHKIAYAMGVIRLQGLPIDLPVSALLGGIKAVRAHFYAAYHSGRKEENPISRETLRELTGIPERTQRAYDEVAQVKRQKNIAIGERYTRANVEERAYQNGKATFHFVDMQGWQGKAKREYIAWHLPNSYYGPHSCGSKSRRKKINRKLADLFMKGMTGNDERTVEKLFWPHGAAASKAYNRNHKRDAYWPGNPTRSKRFNPWHVLPGGR